MDSSKAPRLGAAGVIVLAAATAAACHLARAGVRAVRRAQAVSLLRRIERANESSDRALAARRASIDALEARLRAAAGEGGVREEALAEALGALDDDWRREVAAAVEFAAA